MRLDLVHPFVDDLLIDENINEVKSKTKSFQDLVINSTLINDEKLHLSSVSNIFLGLASFVESGGIDEAQNVLSQEFKTIDSLYDRTIGCSVKMIDV